MFVIKLKNFLMKENKIVYVTGCLGFIGSYVTRACLNKGWYVRGIDKITYASNTNLLKEFEDWDTFTFEQTDINDLEFLYECDYVINTAAETHVGNSIVKSEEFMHSNIDGVHNLLELIKNYRAEGKNSPILLHFSTDEVYGDITDGEHIETDILKPSNPYSSTKAAADQLIFGWARTYGIKYVIVRPTNNYGIGQYVEKLIPKTVKYLGLGKKVPLHNHGLPIRNWLHVEDTAEAIINIIDSNVENEIYNICGGYEQPNLYIVNSILQKYINSTNLDDKAVTNYLDFSYSRQGQDIRYALNDDKLKKLGWKPKKEFEKELQKIVDYYKNTFIW